MSSAARTRRWRDRARRYVTLVEIEIPVDLVSDLIAMKVLNPNHAESKQKIIEALHRLHEIAVTRHAMNGKDGVD